MTDVAVGFHLVPLLVGLLLVGLAVGGIVLLFVKLRAKAWWVLAPVGAVFLLAAFLWRVGVPTEPLPGPPRGRDVARPMGVPSPRGSEAKRELLPTPSDGALMSGFLADRYPSAMQAAEALARLLSPSVATVSAGGGHEAPTVRVTGQAPAELLRLVAEVLHKDALVRDVVIPLPEAPATQPAGGDAISCGVRMEGEQEGSVQIVLSGPRGQLSRSTQFVSKPWAANFARFLSDANDSYVLARSGRPCPTRGEAEQAALDNAAAQLAPRILLGIDRGVADRRYDPSGRPTPREVRTWLADELRGAKVLQDRFMQRFERPYGDVWQHALLVRASPEALDKIAASVARTASGQHRARMHTWYSRIGSVVGLLALILAAYVVLNAATKGYYVWVLRLAAGALVAGGAAVLMMIA